MGDSWNLRNTNRFRFQKARVSSLSNFSQELVDLKSIQLLGSHVDELK